MARTSSPRSQKLQTAQVLHLGSKFSPCCHPSCPLASPECFNNISLHAQIWRLPIFMHTSWLMEAWCRCWFQTWSIYFVVDASLFRFRVAIQYGFQVVGAAAHCCGNTNDTAKSMLKIRYKRHWSLPNAVTSALPTGHSTVQLRPSRLHPSVHSWGAGWIFEEESKVRETGTTGTKDLPFFFTFLGTALLSWYLRWEDWRQKPGQNYLEVMENTANIQIIQLSNTL